MTEHSETIAKLTGKLLFDIDVHPLQRFLSMLLSAETQMKRLGAEAEQLSKALNMKLGITGNTEAKQKLDTQVQQNLAKSLKLEQAVQRTRRETFQAEIAGQKLTSLGTKENGLLQNNLLKTKIAQAVLDAKSAKVEQEKLKTAGISIRQEQSVLAAKTRQQKLEEVLLQTKAKGALLAEKQIQSLTTTQRLELALQQTRERGQRAIERYHATNESRRQRAARAEVRQGQQDQRFGWAAQRHQQ